MSKRITLRDKDGKVIAVQEVEEEGDFGYVSTNEQARALMLIVLLVIVGIASLFGDGSGGGYDPEAKHASENSSDKKSFESSESYETGGGYSPGVQDGTENISNQVSEDKTIIDNKNLDKRNIDTNKIEKQAKQDDGFVTNFNNHHVDEIRNPAKGVTYLYLASDKKIENGDEIIADYYFNKVSGKDNNLITVDILGNLSSNGKRFENDLTKYSFIATNQYDCNKMQARTLKLSTFDNMNGAGAMLSNPQFDNSWKPFSMHNLERIKQKICN